MSHLFSIQKMVGEFIIPQCTTETVEIHQNQSIENVNHNSAFSEIFLTARLLTVKCFPKSMNAPCGFFFFCNMENEYMYVICSTIVPTESGFH